MIVARRVRGGQGERGPGRSRRVVVGRQDLVDGRPHGIGREAAAGQQRVGAGARFGGLGAVVARGRLEAPGLLLQQRDGGVRLRALAVTLEGVVDMLLGDPFAAQLGLQGEAPPRRGAALDVVLGEAPVVEEREFDEARDDALDIGLGQSAPAQPLADLGDGVGLAAEEPERVVPGAFGRQRTCGAPARAQRSTSAGRSPAARRAGSSEARRLVASETAQTQATSNACTWTGSCVMK